MREGTGPFQGTAAEPDRNQVVNTAGRRNKWCYKAQQYPSMLM